MNLYEYNEKISQVIFFRSDRSGAESCQDESFTYPSLYLHFFCMKLKENSGILKPRPYFWLEIRLSTHRQQFGEGRHPLRAI